MDGSQICCDRIFSRLLLCFLEPPEIHLAVDDNA